MPIIKRVPTDKKNNNILSKFGKNITSQGGEDGIIEKIFSILPPGSKSSVEVGAWDGKHYSNTWNLVKNLNWKGALIEANAGKFKDLVETYVGCENANCINKFVNLTGSNTLDIILDDIAFEKEFGLLSIDIDGNDYYVWESLERHRPRVVVIEFNLTVPNNVIFIQDADFSLNQGCSLMALIDLGKRKGYELVATTTWNAIFVQKESFPLFNIENNHIENMYQEDEYKTEIFQLYDGTLQISGCNRLLWHGNEINVEKLQVLPKSERFYPDQQSEKKR